MKITRLIALTASTLLAGMPLLKARPRPAHKENAQAEVQTLPEVLFEDHHDTSPPLRDMAERAPKPQWNPAQPVRVIPLRPRPGAPFISSEPDSVVQETAPAGPLVPTTNFTSFDGVPNVNGVVPPDPNASVGATQIVETVNIAYQVFSKTGASLLGPININTLWSNFGGGCQNNNDGDPVVVYDKAASRWVITQFSISTTPYLECVAVSTSSDATGSYNRYAFQMPNFPDYPKLAVWPDAYYASFNMFSGNSFVGARACAFQRGAMLSGASATSICFQRSSSDFGLLPSDLDGSTQPPSGEPNFFLEIGSSSSLNLFKFHVDFTTPTNSTFTGPTSIPVASFSEPCPSVFRMACIPQPGTSEELEAIGDRLMFRLAYRNFSDHEALVVNHSVVAGSSVGVRWYEIRSPNGTPTVFQQGTYAPDSNFRWMGSIAMDASGNIALGYSVSSSSMFPSIVFTGRSPGDSLGTMEAQSTIIAGAGSQTSFTRWGDYSSMAIDPTDDSTFVYTSEYYTSASAGASTNWSTRIATFRLAENFSLSATPCSQTVHVGNSISYTTTVSVSGGVNDSVVLSASGLPAGATATFNPTSITGPGSSTLTVSTSSSTPAGNYTLTITGTSGTTTHSTTATLAVASSGTPGTGTVTISGTEKGVCLANCHPCAKSCATWDTGSVWITVNGVQVNASYGQNSFSFTIAQALANAINSDCSYPVSATVSSSTITLTARTFGTATNYTLSAGSQSDDQKDFPTPSFTATPSGTNLTGGTN